MKANDLFARRKRRFKLTTDSNHNYPIAPNMLEQDFKVSRKNQVWLSDITYIETKQGWTYLTVIIDLFHRKVIGWSMSESLRTDDTIIPAWHMAIKSNTITEELIFHRPNSKIKANILVFLNSLVADDWDNAGHPMQWQNHFSKV